MPDDLFTTSGYGTMAKELYASAGIGPDEVSVASLYDHFTGMILLQLEDFGLAPRGESGPFVESGGIRFDGERSRSTRTAAASPTPTAMGPRMSSKPPARFEARPPTR